MMGALGDEVFDDFGGVDTGKAAIEALETVAEAVVFEAEQVQDGGVEVADVEGVFDDVVGEVVGFAIDGAAFGTAAGHPHGEAAGVVVATVVVSGEAALGVDGAAEFAAPDDEGVFEHAALFKVFDEGVAGLVDVFALGGHATVDVGVVVPVVVVDLHEADAAFDEAAGHEGTIGEGAGFFGVFAVEFEDVFGFLGEVSEFGHAGLHAERHFVLLDASVGLGVGDFLVGDFVEGVDAIEGFAADGGGDARGIVDVEDGVASGTEGDAGVFAGEVAGGPEAGGDGLFLGAVGGGGDEDDEGREVLIHGAEAVGGPGAEAGAAGDLVAGLHGSNGGLVVDGFGMEGAHPTDIVCGLAEVGEEFVVHPHAAGAFLGEAVFGGGDGEAGLAAGHGGEALALADTGGEVFVVELLHLRFVVEEIHLGGATDHVEVNDAFGFGGEVGLLEVA